MGKLERQKLTFTAILVIAPLWAALRYGFNVGSEKAAGISCVVMFVALGVYMAVTGKTEF